MRAVRLVVALVAALLVLTGCTGDAPFPGPGPAKIDVDTPELRETKADAGIEPCRPGDGAPVSGGLPEVTLPCFGGGKAVDLSSLRGPMVVNLWASYCGPCRTEMPVLQQFHEQHGERVPLIGIDYQDAQVEGAMELARDSGVTYPLLADPQGELQGAEPFPGNLALPIFAFVDDRGDATVVAAGIESLEELTEMVDEHLGIEL